MGFSLPTPPRGYTTVWLQSSTSGRQIPEYAAPGFDETCKYVSYQFGQKFEINIQCDQGPDAYLGFFAEIDGREADYFFISRPAGSKLGQDSFSMKYEDPLSGDRNHFFRFPREGGSLGQVLVRVFRLTPLQDGITKTDYLDVFEKKGVIKGGPCYHKTYNSGGPWPFSKRCEVFGKASTDEPVAVFRFKHRTIKQIDELLAPPPILPDPEPTLRVEIGPLAPVQKSEFPTTASTYENRVPELTPKTQPALKNRPAELATVKQVPSYAPRALAPLPPLSENLKNILARAQRVSPASPPVQPTPKPVERIPTQASKVLLPPLLPTPKSVEIIPTQASKALPPPLLPTPKPKPVETIPASKSSGLPPPPAPRTVKEISARTAKSLCRIPPLTPTTVEKRLATATNKPPSPSRLQQLQQRVTISAYPCIPEFGSIVDQPPAVEHLTEGCEGTQRQALNSITNQTFDSPPVISNPPAPTANEKKVQPSKPVEQSKGNEAAEGATGRANDRSSLIHSVGQVFNFPSWSSSQVENHKTGDPSATLTVPSPLCSNYGLRTLGRIWASTWGAKPMLPPFIPLCKYYPKSAPSSTFKEADNVQTNLLKRKREEYDVGRVFVKRR